MEWSGLWYWLPAIVAALVGILCLLLGIRHHRYRFGEMRYELHKRKRQLDPSIQARQPQDEPRTMASAIPRPRSQGEPRWDATEHAPAEDVEDIVAAVAAENNALEVTAGRLNYQIPEGMWRGMPETVEVRLGPLEAQGIMDNFGGRGEVKAEKTPIVETMAVSLVAEPGIFVIEERSPRDQLVKPDLVKGTPLEQHDFAKWTWIVIPRKRGKHKLYVKISAALKDSRGLPVTSALPDRMFPVIVKVRVTRAVIGAVSRLAVGLGGGRRDSFGRRIH